MLVGLDAIIYLSACNSSAVSCTANHYGRYRQCFWGWRLQSDSIESVIRCSTLRDYSFSRHKNIREVVVPCHTWKVYLQLLLVGCVWGLHNATVKAVGSLGIHSFFWYCLLTGIYSHLNLLSTLLLSMLKCYLHQNLNLINQTNMRGLWI